MIISHCFDIRRKNSNFGVQPDEETGSAEEQPASNMATPILIAERYPGVVMMAAPFAIRQASRL